MPWTAKVLGSNLSRKYSVSNEIVGQLFVWLFVVGIVVIILEAFFFAARIFL